MDDEFKERQKKVAALLEPCKKYGLDDDDIKRIDGWKDAQWNEFLLKYQFEDIEPYLNPSASDSILCCLAGILLNELYDKNDMFFRVEPILHRAVRLCKRDEFPIIVCVMAYVHILIDRDKYYHAENVLKFEIRHASGESRKNPLFAEWHFLLGIVLLQQNKSDEAIEAFTFFDDLLEGHKDSNNWGNYAAPKKTFTERKARALRYLGSAWFLKNSRLARSKAEGFYYAVLDLEPKEADSITALSSISKPRRIIACKDSFVAANNLADHLIERKAEKKKIRECIKLLENILGQIEKKKGPWGGFRSQVEKDFYRLAAKDTAATFRIFEGRYKDAECLLEKALEPYKDGPGARKKLPPQAVAVHYHCGLALFLQGQYREATYSFKKVIEYEDSKQNTEYALSQKYVSRSYEALGVIRLKQNNASGAKKSFDNALSVDPGNASAKDRLNSIASSTESVAWYAWWTASNGKKIALGILCVGVFLTLVVPPFSNIPATEEIVERRSVSSVLANDTGTPATGGEGAAELEDAAGASTSSVTKTVTYAHFLSERQLIFAGILIFIILMPSIRKIKVAGLEIETAELNPEPSPKIRI